MYYCLSIFMTVVELDRTPIKSFLKRYIPEVLQVGNLKEIIDGSDDSKRSRLINGDKKCNITKFANYLEAAPEKYFPLLVNKWYKKVQDWESWNEKFECVKVIAERIDSTECSEPFGEAKEVIASFYEQVTKSGNLNNLANIEAEYVNILMARFLAAAFLYAALASYNHRATEIDIAELFNNILNVYAEEQLKIDPDDMRCFCSTGKEFTVLRMEKSNNKMKVIIDFSPHVMRPDIPEWCSVVRIFSENTDVSRYRIFRFRIISSENLISMHLELKSNSGVYEEKITIKEKGQVYEVPISKLNNKVLREICFVIRLDDLESIVSAETIQAVPNNLKASLELSSIEFIGSIPNQ